jgi:uncharacterized membrane protein
MSDFGTVFSFLPFAVNLVVSIGFLSTLRRGNTPLITAIAQIEQGGTIPAELAVHTRRLTAVWGLLLFSLAVKHLFLEWPHDLWFLSVAADSLAIGLFFLLDFGWRALRFPGYTFASPWRLIKLIRQQGGIYRLYRQCLA